MSSQPVAIIDIGSNTIKLLVASRGSTKTSGVEPLVLRTIDARISTGLGQEKPLLGEAGMKRGIEAITALLAEAAPHTPLRTVLVATSAVRDARNGREFRTRIQEATGHHVRLLFGEEEARLIGRGLGCDPALRDKRDLYVFDLGGGSLECLVFRDRQIETAVSLSLGCVRLTEKFVAQPAKPVPPAVWTAVSEGVREAMAEGNFEFSLPAGAIAVGTGGTLTTVRAILGVRNGQPFDETSPVITSAVLRNLCDTLGALSLEERRNVGGLPPARADVFPVALATFLAIAEAGNFSKFRNSLYTLRYGLADEALD